MFSRFSAKEQSELFSIICKIILLMFDILINSFVAGNLRCPEHLLRWLLQRWPTYPFITTIIINIMVFFAQHPNYHDHPICYKLVRLLGRACWWWSAATTWPTTRSPAWRSITGLDQSSWSWSWKFKIIKNTQQCGSNYNTFCIRKKFSWSRGPPTRAKRDSCRFLEPHAGHLGKNCLAFELYLRAS